MAAITLAYRGAVRIMPRSGISRVPRDSCHLSKANNSTIGQARGVVHLLALFHRWTHILAHLQGLEAKCVEVGVGGAIGSLPLEALNVAAVLSQYTSGELRSS